MRGARSVRSSVPSVSSASRRSRGSIKRCRVCRRHSRRVWSSASPSFTATGRGVPAVSKPGQSRRQHRSVHSPHAHIGCALRRLRMGGPAVFPGVASDGDVSLWFISPTFLLAEMEKERLRPCGKQLNKGGHHVQCCTKHTRGAWPVGYNAVQAVKK